VEIPQSCIHNSYAASAAANGLQVKPIGVLQMLDQGERDDKIIAVHCHDPSYRNFNDISELPSHRLAEIRSFFEDYKKNEHKVRALWFET
jgi:inorganic pyrophosphatase